MLTTYFRNACFFVHPVVKTSTSISPLHHHRGTAAGCLWGSTTQQQQPRGLLGNTLNHTTFNSGTMAQPPLGLPHCWCLFSQSLPFPETIWGILHMKAKANFGASGLLWLNAWLTSQGTRLLRVEDVQPTTIIWCQIPVNTKGTITSSQYERSLEVCVWSVMRITPETVSKQEGRVIQTWCLWQKKATFPDAGTLLTRIPSARLLLALPLHMWWIYLTSTEAGRWFGQ